MTPPQVIHAHDEEPIGVHRLAGTYQVVPPTHVGWVLRIEPGHVMRRVQGVAHQHGIVPRCVGSAVGLVGELVAFENRAAAQLKRTIEPRDLRYDYA